jgi:hypothetical protein
VISVFADEERVARFPTRRLQFATRVSFGCRLEIGVPGHVRSRDVGLQTDRSLCKRERQPRSASFRSDRERLRGQEERDEVLPQGLLGGSDHAACCR